MMEHLEQLEKTLNIESKRPSVKCKLFEDNNDAIELAKAPKIRHRTKHISLKYNHFREHVQKGLIEINPIDTLEQVADIFTKTLPFLIFNYLKKKIRNGKVFVNMSATCSRVSIGLFSIRPF